MIFVNGMCLHAKSFQSCPTLCNPIDYSLRGSSIMGFSRQEYWSGLPCPPPEALPNPGIKAPALISPVLTGWFFITSTTWEAHELWDLMQSMVTRVNNTCHIIESI